MSSGETGNVRSWVRVVGVNVAVFVAIVLGAEACWRLLVPLSEQERRSREFARFSLELLEPCARIVAVADERVLVSEHGASFRVPAARPEHGIRIVVVGESSGADFAAALQREARARQLGAVEVLDCAAPGAALEHVERRIAEVLDYDPDIVVLAAGHNLEFRYSMDASALRRAATAPVSRLAAGLAARLRRPRALPAGDPEDRLRRWERLLATSAHSARERGIGFAAVALPTNLFVPPPRPAGAPLDSRELEAYWRAIVSGTADAVAWLEPQAGHGMPATLEFVLGVLQVRSGAAPAARFHLENALEGAPSGDSPYHPSGRDRARRGVVEAVRGGATRHGFDLIDVARNAERHARDSLPGWDVMIDHCHLNASLWDEIARERLAHWVPAEAPSDPEVRLPPERLRTLRNLVHSSTKGSVNDPFAAVALAVERWLRDDPDATAKDVADFVSGDTFGAASPDGQLALVAGIAWAYWSAGHEEEAWEWNRRMRQFGAADAHVQAGLFAAGGAAFAAAREAFARGLQLDPQRQDVPFYLSRLASLETAGAP